MIFHFGTVSHPFLSVSPPPPPTPPPFRPFTEGPDPPLKLHQNNIPEIMYLLIVVFLLGVEIAGEKKHIFYLSGMIRKAKIIFRGWIVSKTFFDSCNMIKMIGVNFAFRRGTKM